jgi:hypothetical protein
MTLSPSDVFAESSFFIRPQKKTPADLKGEVKNRRGP